jgi:hypothetical protein
MNMRGTRVSVVALVVAIVAVAFGVYGFSKPPTVETSLVYETTTAYRTSYSYNETTVYRNVEVTGVCTATSYFLGDEAQEYVWNVTITSGTHTMYSTSESYSYPNTTTLGSTTYSTFTFGNFTAPYSTTSTSLDQNYAPSGWWLVTGCTYEP